MNNTRVLAYLQRYFLKTHWDPTNPVKGVVGIPFTRLTNGYGKTIKTKSGGYAIQYGDSALKLDTPLRPVHDEWVMLYISEDRFGGLDLDVETNDGMLPISNLSAFANMYIHTSTGQTLYTKDGFVWLNGTDDEFSDSLVVALPVSQVKEYVTKDAKLYLDLINPVFDRFLLGHDDSAYETGELLNKAYSLSNVTANPVMFEQEYPFAMVNMTGSSSSMANKISQYWDSGKPAVGKQLTVFFYTKQNDAPYVGINVFNDNTNDFTAYEFATDSFTNLAANCIGAKSTVYPEGLVKIEARITVQSGSYVDIALVKPDGTTGLGSYIMSGTMVYVAPIFYDASEKTPLPFVTDTAGLQEYGYVVHLGRNHMVFDVAKHAIREFTIGTLPMFRNKHGIDHYLLHFPKTTFEGKIINPRLCQIYLMDGENGYCLNPYLYKSKVAVTHHDFAIPVSLINRLKKTLSSSVKIFVAIPKDMVTHDVIEENNLIKKLYASNEDATIVSYLTKPVRNNSRSFWSAEHLLESEYGRIIEAPSYTILGRYDSAEAYSSILGYRNTLHVLSYPVLDMSTPNGKVLMPPVFEDSASFTLHNDDGVRVDESDFTAVVEDNVVTFSSIMQPGIVVLDQETNDLIVFGNILDNIGAELVIDFWFRLDAFDADGGNTFIFTNGTTALDSGIMLYVDTIADNRTIQAYTRIGGNGNYCNITAAQLGYASDAEFLGTWNHVRMTYNEFGGVLEINMVSDYYEATEMPGDLLSSFFMGGLPVTGSRTSMAVHTVQVNGRSYGTNFIETPPMWIDDSEHNNTALIQAMNPTFENLDVIGEDKTYYVEFASNKPGAVHMVLPGGSREIPRVAEDYTLLMYVNDTTERWEDVSKDAHLYVEHAFVNEQGWIRFKTSCASELFVVCFGELRFDATFTEDGTYAFHHLAMTPDRYWCNGADLLKIQREKITPQFVGELALVNSETNLVDVTCNRLMSNAPHPQCMSTHGRDISDTQILRYTPSADLQVLGYELFGVRISYAYDQNYSPNNLSSFLTDRNIQNYLIPIVEDTTDPDYPSNLTLNSHYRSYMVEQVTVGGQTIPLDFSKTIDNSIFIPLSDAMLVDDALDMDFHVPEGEIRRLAKVEFVFKFSGSTNVTEEALKIDYPLKNVYSLVYNGVKRIHPDVEYALDDYEENGWTRNGIKFIPFADVQTDDVVTVSLVKKLQYRRTVRQFQDGNEMIAGLPEEPPIGSPSIIPITTALATNGPDGFTPPGYGPENALLPTDSFRRYGNTGDTVYWEMLITSNGEVGIEKLFIEPDTDANVPFTDVYVELYDEKNRLHAVAHIDHPIQGNIMLESFYAPDTEGRPTSRVFESITASRIRIVRRSLVPSNNGLALKRVIAYQVEWGYTVPEDLYNRYLAIRCINHRVLPIDVDYVDPFSDYVEDAIICTDLTAYNLLEQVNLAGVQDNLYLLSITN